MRILACIVAVLALWGGNAWAAPAKTDRLLVVGSTTVLPAVSLAAEVFNQRSPGAITVNPGGSGVGVNSVGQGRAPIGMVSREISPEERRRFAGARLMEHVIGYDRVACVVSSEIFAAGVKALSREEIRQIYLGEIKNWKHLGGPDREIVVVDKERHRGTRHAFMQYVFGDATARAPAARLVTGSNNEEQAKIAASDSAIGLLSFAWVNDDVKAVGLKEGGAIMRPEDPAYPIVRPLALVTAGEPEGLAREFILYLLGPEGRKIVERLGYQAALGPGR